MKKTIGFVTIILICVNSNSSADLIAVLFPFLIIAIQTRKLLFFSIRHGPSLNIGSYQFRLIFFFSQRLYNLFFMLCTEGFQCDS